MAQQFPFELDTFHKEPLPNCMQVQCTFVAACTSVDNSESSPSVRHYCMIQLPLWQAEANMAHQIPFELDTLQEEGVLHLEQSVITATHASASKPVLMGLAPRPHACNSYHYCGPRPNMAHQLPFQLKTFQKAAVSRLEQGQSIFMAMQANLC